MRQRFAKTRAGSMTAAAVLAVAGLGSAAQANLVLDLRLAGGGNATTVAPGAVVNLQVYGRITGGATTAQIQDAFFGVTNTSTAAGGVGNLSAVTLQGAFTGVATDVSPCVTTSSSGSLYATSGGMSVGSTDSTSATGWVFARATSMQPAATDSIGTLLGTLTYTVNGGAANGSTATLAVSPRQAANSLVIPAVWTENGTEKDGGAGYSDQVGQSVAITVAAAVQFNIADFNHDGVVNFDDFGIMVNHYGQNGQTNATGDTNGDGVIDFNDFGTLVNNYNHVGPAPSGVDLAAALVAVPEPASLGLIGVGALGLLSRRRK